MDARTTTRSAAGALAGILLVAPADAQDFALADADMMQRATLANLSFVAMAAERPFQRPLDLVLPTDPPGTPEAPTSRISLSAGVGWTNKYYFRGIRQEDDGFIAQPWIDLGFTLIDTGDTRIGLFAGTWHSVHGDDDTGSPGSGVRNYYEADVYGGVSITRGNLTLNTFYTAYTSPSEAFQTVHEFDVSLAWDDSNAPLLGALTLNPYASFAFEIRDIAADGQNTGGYVELGVAPTKAWDTESAGGFTLALPLTLGLSMYDYFEAADGSDDTFGFFDVGLDASWTLPTSGPQISLDAGVHLLLLGDNLRALNDGDDAEVIVTAGISIAF